MSKTPVLPDLQTIMQAGFDPKTGLPLKLSVVAKPMLKENIRKVLRVMDEQNAITRYEWENLPCNLTSEELERMLYYKSQLAFFYIADLDEFYFMPYALDGTIDFYGRFNTVHPVPMASGTTEDKKAAKTQEDYLSSLKLKCIYDVKQIKEGENKNNYCVLLSDYSKQLSQTNISRQVLQEPILDAMAEAFPLARTSLIANSGVKGMRVQDEDQSANVKEASRGLTKAALEGDPWIPIVGKLDFQDLTNGTALKSEEYLLYMQALDNFRLSTYGLNKGGLYQKKAHVLEGEQEANENKNKGSLVDGLKLREHFAEVANKIWGLNIKVKKGEVDKEGEAVEVDNQPKEEEK